MEQVLVNPVKKTLSLNLPQHFEDVLLLCPGVWNKLEYTSQEIQNAFLNTDWTDKSNTHLYLDHQDTKEFGVANWAGFVKNPRMINGELRGDLEIWDESTARYLKEAEAKFGVSATLAGLEDEEGSSMRNFHFESFSIVTNPACKPAWINLSQEVGIENKKITGFEAVRKRMGLSASQFYAAPRDPPSSSKLPIFDASHVRNAVARFNQTQFSSPEEKSKAWGKVKAAAKKFGIKISKDLDNDLSKNSTSLGDNQLNIGVNMEKKKLDEEKATEEEDKDEAKPDESKDEEKTVENDDNDDEDEDKDEDSDDEKSDKELSSGDLLKQLNSKFDRLLSVLEKKPLAAHGDEEEMPKKKKKLENTLDVGMSKIRKELSEIKEKLVEKDEVKVERKTLAVSSNSMVPDNATDADHGMLQYLQRRI